MAALVQPYLSAIGLTNRVQPYCRFAIIAMQTMPMTSCIHRYEAGLVIALRPPASASLCINSSFVVPISSDIPESLSPMFTASCGQRCEACARYFDLSACRLVDGILCREHY